jgi:hypothetical protein
MLPFLLLILLSQCLPLRDPSPVFGLALVPTVLWLGVTRLFPLTWLPPVGLGCVLVLEHAWHFAHFSVSGSPDAAPVAPRIHAALCRLAFTPGLSPR